MISRNATRKALFRCLEKEDPDRTLTKDWIMAPFRHAVFETADKCRSLIGCRYALDIKNKKTICFLFSKTRTYKCTYAFEEDENENVLIEELRSVEQDGQELECLVKAQGCAANEVADVIHSWQPKLKIVKK